MCFFFLGGVGARAPVRDSREGKEEEEKAVVNVLLSCFYPTAQLDGIVVTLPESMHNMLEIPLWLRNR